MTASKHKPTAHTTPSTKAFEEKSMKSVYNLIILDESGSMDIIRTQALTGVNETLQTIRDAEKENPGMQQYVTLMSFDTRHFNYIYKLTPAGIAKDITRRQYEPYGGTPLYDAIGKCLIDLQHHVGANDVVLVTVVTDGYENASKEFTAKHIANMITRLRDKGWVFTYIGANQDVEQVAASISINNHMCFEATVAGTTDMFKKENRNRLKFMQRLSVEDENADYKARGANYFEEE